jgi:hypothetical protein
MNLVTPRAADKHMTKFIIVSDMILVMLCYSPLVGLKCYKDDGPQRRAC